MNSLRALRLMRLLRLFRSKDFKKVLFTIVGVLYGLRAFMVLFLLYIYIWSLVGMEFFHNKMRYDPSTGLPIERVNSPEYFAAVVPHRNFDDWPHAFMAVFGATQGDGWNWLMYDLIRSFGFAVSIFPLSCFYFGNNILISIYVAMVIDSVV